MTLRKALSLGMDLEGVFGPCASLLETPLHEVVGASCSIPVILVSPVGSKTPSVFLAFAEVVDL